MKGKFKVTPSVGVNVRSGPGSGYGKVGAYACGTVVAVDEVREGWGKTGLGWVSMSYLEAVSSGQEADRVTDTGLVISRDFIPPGRKNRPGKANPCKYITIHETGNTAQSADAQAHASYLKSSAAALACAAAKSPPWFTQISIPMLVPFPGLSAPSPA